jgi:hypothetical protein
MKRHLLLQQELLLPTRQELLSPTLLEQFLLLSGELSTEELYILDSGELDNILHLRDFCYDCARTKLDVMAFLHVGLTYGAVGILHTGPVGVGDQELSAFLHFIKCNAMYDYTGPLDRFPPWSEVVRFLKSEFTLIRAAMPPLLFSAVQYRKEMCFRWRTAFPPVWYIHVTRARGVGIWRRALPRFE